MNRVYDKRTNETLYGSDDIFDCVEFININFNEDDDDFEHIWIERIVGRISND